MDEHLKANMSFCISMSVSGFGMHFIKAACSQWFLCTSVTLFQVVCRF